MGAFFGSGPQRHILGIEQSKAQDEPPSRSDFGAPQSPERLARLSCYNAQLHQKSRGQRVILPLLTVKTWTHSVSNNFWVSTAVVFSPAQHRDVLTRLDELQWLKGMDVVCLAKDLEKFGHLSEGSPSPGVRQSCGSNALPIDFVSD
jgi:hypothetical protein